MTKQNLFQKDPQDLQKNLDEFNRELMEQETRAKAESLGVPYIDLHNFPVDLNSLGMFTKEQAEEMQAVPFYREGKDLRVGAVNLQGGLLKDKIQELSLKHKVSMYLVSKKSLDQVMRFYSKVMPPAVVRDETIRVEKEQDYTAVLKALQDEAVQKQKNASEFLEIMFGAAMFFGASDIHLEPEEHFFKLRFRVDGVLQDMLHIAKDLQKSLTMRIKILSKMKLNVSDLPQDGRITFYYLGKPIDVRVSLLPSAFGEEAVMRLLGTGAINLKLTDLGFRKEHQEILNRQLSKPNGMIITTGPTGSGKTTTLYAFLNQLNEPGVKIITLEDPVEYKLEGIVQTPIDHSHDFSFAKGLRAILRQDPDIIMVGEIRDQETAEVSTQAALTGHLVLSTLHTNDAAGAIPRLLNMGVKAFVLGPAIAMVMAQRLTRKICEKCKTKVALSPTVMEKISYTLNKIPAKSGIKAPKSLQFYHSPGCDACHHLGYKGRIGIYEVLENTDTVQALIAKENSSMIEFKKAGIEQGMITMLQDGLLKALDGITDVEEVFRVAGEE
jgi:type IV pilus assembly protein PilB